MFLNIYISEQINRNFWFLTFPKLKKGIETSQEGFNSEHYDSDELNLSREIR